MATQTRQAPYRHTDGSNCWTKECSLNHVTSEVAFKQNNASAFLSAKTNEASSRKVHRSLEYGSPDYKLFMRKSEELAYQTSAAEYQAVMEYTGWAYKQYYSYLEGKNSNGTEFGSQYDEATQAALIKATAKGTETLDSFVSKGGKLDKPVNVYRGEKPRPGISVADHLAKTYPVGGEVEIKRFLSTSMDSKVASEILGSDENSGYLLVIKTKEGAMIGESLSEQSLREKEVLLPRNRKFKVEKISKDIVGWGITRRTHTTVHLTLLD